MARRTFNLAVVNLATLLVLSSAPSFAAESENLCSGSSGSVEINGKIVGQWGQSQEECTRQLIRQQADIQAMLKDDKKMREQFIKSCESFKDDPQKYKTCMELAFRIGS